jgi:molybdopterin/thiamine biosynthesis adenylyltransferase
MSVQNRFKDAPWMQGNPLDIIIGGAGGIGSWLSLYLSRMGHYITIYDHDVIETHNLGGQLYQAADIGSNKADCAVTWARQCADNHEVVSEGKYTKNSMSAPVMFTCFDNMASRKLMLDNWKQYRIQKPEEFTLFIDGRMSVETLQVYCLQDAEDIARYESEFFDDNEVGEEACSFKATSHCGAMCAAMMSSLLTNALANYYKGLDLREVPYNVEFEITTMNYGIRLKEDYQEEPSEVQL